MKRLSNLTKKGDSLIRSKRFPKSVELYLIRLCRKQEPVFKEIEDIINKINASIEAKI